MASASALTNSSSTEHMDGAPVGGSPSRTAPTQGTPLFLFCCVKTTGTNILTDEVSEIVVKCWQYKEVVPIFYCEILTERRRYSGRRNRREKEFPQAARELLYWIERMTREASSFLKMEVYPVLFAHGGDRFDFLHLFHSFAKYGIAVSELQRCNLHFADPLPLLEYLKLKRHPLFTECRSLALGSLLNDWFPGMFNPLDVHLAQARTHLLSRLYTETTLYPVLYKVPIYNSTEWNQYYEDAIKFKEDKIELEARLPKHMKDIHRKFAVREIQRAGYDWQGLLRLFQECSSPLQFRQELRDLDVKSSSARDIAWNIAAMKLEQYGTRPYIVKIKSNMAPQRYVALTDRRRRYHVLRVANVLPPCFLTLADLEFSMTDHPILTPDVFSLQDRMVVRSWSTDSGIEVEPVAEPACMALRIVDSNLDSDDEGVDSDPVWREDEEPLSFTEDEFREFYAAKSSVKDHVVTSFVYKTGVDKNLCMRSSEEANDLFSEENTDEMAADGPRSHIWGEIAAQTSESSKSSKRYKASYPQKTAYVNGQKRDSFNRNQREGKRRASNPSGQCKFTDVKTGGKNSKHKPGNQSNVKHKEVSQSGDCKLMYVGGDKADYQSNSKHKTGDKLECKHTVDDQSNSTHKAFDQSNSTHEAGDQSHSKHKAFYQSNSTHEAGDQSHSKHKAFDQSNNTHEAGDQSHSKHKAFDQSNSTHEASAQSHSKGFDQSNSTHEASDQSHSKHKAVNLSKSQHNASDQSNSKHRLVDQSKSKQKAVSQSGDFSLMDVSTGGKNKKHMPQGQVKMSGDHKGTAHHCNGASYLHCGKQNGVEPQNCQTELESQNVDDINGAVKKGHLSKLESNIKKGKPCIMGSTNGHETGIEQQIITNRCKESLESQQEKDTKDRHSCEKVKGSCENIFKCNCSEGSCLCGSFSEIKEKTVVTNMYIVEGGQNSVGLDFDDSVDVGMLPVSLITRHHYQLDFIYPDLKFLKCEGGECAGNCIMGTFGVGSQNCHPSGENGHSLPSGHIPSCHPSCTTSSALVGSTSHVLEIDKFLRKSLKMDET